MPAGLQRFAWHQTCPAALACRAAMPATVLGRLAVLALAYAVFAAQQLCVAQAPRIPGPNSRATMSWYSRSISSNCRM